MQSMINRTRAQEDLADKSNGDGLSNHHRNQNHIQDGSDRKNPLAYLLASANASVDTTTQAAGNDGNHHNMLSRAAEPASTGASGKFTARKRTIFREEPVIRTDVINYADSNPGSASRVNNSLSASNNLANNVTNVADNNNIDATNMSSS